MHTFHKKSEILQRWLDFTTNFRRFSRYNGFSQILQKSWFRSFVWKLKLKLKLYNGNTTFWESHLNIHIFHDEFFGLISESLSIFLKSPKQGAKSLAWALYTFFSRFEPKWKIYWFQEIFNYSILKIYEIFCQTRNRKEFKPIVLKLPEWKEKVATQNRTD